MSPPLTSEMLTIRRAAWHRRRARRRALIATMLLGGVFLGIKAFEYYTEWAEHHVPGLNYQFEAKHYQHAQLFF